jgi:lipopolysaccharide/colanic/teichoic acid biosynthesis glycosyltransferase
MTRAEVLDELPVFTVPVRGDISFVWNRYLTFHEIHVENDSHRGA